MSLSRRAFEASAFMRPSSLLLFALIFVPDLGLGDDGEVRWQMSCSLSSALTLFVCRLGIHI
jgi:hypothetical protein